MNRIALLPIGSPVYHSKAHRVNSPVVGPTGNLQSAYKRRHAFTRQFTTISKGPKERKPTLHLHLSTRGQLNSPLDSPVKSEPGLSSPLLPPMRNKGQALDRIIQSCTHLQSVSKEHTLANFCLGQTQPHHSVPLKDLKHAQEEKQRSFQYVSRLGRRKIWKFDYRRLQTRLGYEIQEVCQD